MSQPYSKGSSWYIRLPNGWEMEFTSYEEAWEYFESHR